jgi:hypothetical protein
MTTPPAPEMTELSQELHSINRRYSQLSAVEFDFLQHDAISRALATARAQGRAERSKLDEAVGLLASEAETVCDLFGGDKSVDALRAALSAYLDALKALPEDAG